MKRFLLLFVFISLILVSAPYKPYPILFVHGIGSNSMTWGVKCDKIPERKVWKNNEFYTDSMIQILTSPTESPTYRNMIEIMKPYAWAWYEWGDSTYTFTDTQPAYPNKSFLEVVNMDDPWGSVDYEKDSGFNEYLSTEYECWIDELYHRVKEVLEEYYGEGWENNPDAKVIIICHSTGALTSRGLLLEKPDIVPHIYMIVSADGVNEGSWLATSIFSEVVTWRSKSEIWNTRDYVFFLFLNTPLWKMLSNSVLSIINQWVKDGCWAYEGITIETWDDFLKGFAALEIVAAQPPDDFGGAIGAIVYSKIFGGVWYQIVISGLAGKAFLMGLDERIKAYQAGTVADLSRTSAISRRVREMEMPENVRFGFFVGKEPWNPWEGSFWSMFYWTNTVIGIAHILQHRYVEGAKELLATQLLQVWETHTDFWVMADEQDPTEQDAFKGHNNYKVIERKGIYHTEGTDQWEDFVRLISLPPTLDSVMLVEVKGDTVDTTFLTEGSIDTLMASPESCAIYFKLDNVYFLAQTRVTVNINGAKIGDLRYPDYKGYDDRWCRIPERYMRMLGAGMNVLSIDAENVNGEKCSKSYRIWLVPAGWHVRPWWPNHREVLSDFEPEDTVKLFLVKLGLDSTQMTIEWDSLWIQPAYAKSDPSGKWYFEEDTMKYLIPHEILDLPDGDTIDPNTGDTVSGKYVAIPGSVLMNYMDKDGNGEPDAGGYRIFYSVNDGDKTISFVTGFYIDGNPPSVDLKAPAGVVKKNDSLFVYFKAGDDLEQEVMTPNSFRISVFDDNMGPVFDTVFSEPGCYYYQDRWWNFFSLPLDDGKYMCVLSLYDRAGHFASDTTEFRIDGRPPEFEVVEMMDTVLSTVNQMVECDFIPDEYVVATLNVVKQGDSIPAYSQKFYCGEGETLEVFVSTQFLEDGVYDVSLVFSDSAGNDTVLDKSIFLKGSFLHVDITPPEIADLSCQPLICRDSTNAFFRVSQIKDIPVNRGIVKGFVYVDTALVDSFSSSDTLKSFNFAVSLTGFKTGKHILRVVARDVFGNEGVSDIAVYYGSAGVELACPENGDTLGKGIVGIKGVVNDPDAFNGGRFKCYKLFWKKNDGFTPGVPLPGEWHGEYITATDSRNNTGYSEYSTTALLGTINTDSLEEGFYTLLLVAYDAEDAFLYDTARVFVGNKPVETPDFVMSIELTGNDNVLDNGESLFVNYSIKNIPSDFDLSISDRRGNVVFYAGNNNVLPVYGRPINTDSAGFYLYEIGDTLFVLHRGGGGFEFLSIELSEGDSAIVFDSTGFSGANGISILNNTLTISIMDSLIDSCVVKLKTADFYKIAGTYTSVYAGEDLYRVVAGDVIGGKPFMWTGRHFPEGGLVGTGWYYVRLRATGRDGNCVVEKMDSVYVRHDFHVDSVWVEPVSVSLNDSVPVNIHVIANMDCRVWWNAEQVSGMDTSVVIVGKYGGVIRKSLGYDYFSVDVYRYREFGNGDYRFVLAVTPLSGDTGVIVSTTPVHISGDSVLQAGEEDIYIPERYRVSGNLYNGKPEFGIKAFPVGKYIPPVKYVAEFTRTGYALPDSVKWKMVYGNLYPDSSLVTETHSLPFTVEQDCEGKIYISTSSGDYLVAQTSLKSGDRIYAEARTCELWQQLPDEEEPDTDPSNVPISQFWCVMRNNNIIYMHLCGRDLDASFYVKIRYYKKFDSFDAVVKDSGLVVLVDTGAVEYDYSCFLPETSIIRIYVPKPPDGPVLVASGTYNIVNEYAHEVKCFDIDNDCNVKQVIDTLVSNPGNDTIFRVKLVGDNFEKILTADTVVEVTEIQMIKVEHQYSSVNFFRFYVDGEKVYEGSISSDMQEVYCSDCIVNSTTENFFKVLSFRVNKQNLMRNRTKTIEGYLEYDRYLSAYRRDTVNYSEIFKNYLPLSEYTCVVSGESVSVDTSGDTVIIYTSKNPNTTNWTGLLDDRLFFYNGYLVSGNNYLEMPSLFPQNGIYPQVYFRDVYIEQSFGFDMNCDLNAKLNVVKKSILTDTLGPIPVFDSTRSEISDSIIIHKGLQFLDRKDRYGIYTAFVNDSVFAKGEVEIYGYAPIELWGRIVGFREGSEYVFKEYEVCKYIDIIDSVVLWRMDIPDVKPECFLYLSSNTGPIDTTVSISDRRFVDLKKMVLNGDFGLSNCFKLDEMFPPDSYLIFPDIGETYIDGMVKIYNLFDGFVAEDGNVNRIFDKLDFANSIDFIDKDISGSFIFKHDMQYIESKNNLLYRTDSFISNPNLTIISWDSMMVFNVKGDTSPDIEIVRIDTSGYGRGIHDYFVPGIKLSSKPEEWVPVRGKSDYKYRLFAYNNGRWFNLSGDSLCPASDSDTVLGFLPSSEVAGPVSFYLYQYNDAGEIERVLKRDMYVGDRISLDSVAGTLSVVRSPFGRVTLQFPPDSRMNGRIWNIETHLPDEIEFGGLSPYILGTFSPVVRFIPGGYRPTSYEDAPTIIYRFSFRDIETHDIDPTRIDLYGYTKDGELRRLNAFHHVAEQESLFKLEVSGEIYPLDKELDYIGVLEPDSTVEGVISLFHPMKFHPDSLRITGIANTVPSPESLTFKLLGYCLDSGKKIMGGNKTDSTFKKGVNLMKIFVNRKVMELPNITPYFVFEFTTEKDGYIDEKIPLSTGTKYWFYCIVTKKNGIPVSNSPTGFVPYLDAQQVPLVLEIVGDTNPVIYDTGFVYLHFRVNKHAVLHFFRKVDDRFEEVGTFEMDSSELCPVGWNGFDFYGNPLVNGDYEYRAYATDDFDNESNEIGGFWRIRRTSIVDIVLPERRFVAGNGLLMAQVINYPFVPVDWYYKKNDSLTFIVTQTENGVPGFWDTYALEDGEYKLIATLREPHIGIDSMNVVVDNTAPVTEISFGSPQYYKTDSGILSISSTTPITLTSSDVVSGVDRILYNIDGGDYVSYSGAFTIADEDGKHRLRFYAMDSAGNSEVPLDTFFFLDNTPPVSWLEFGPSARVYNDTVYVSPDESIRVVGRDTMGVATSYYAVFTLSGSTVQDWTEGDAFLIPVVSGEYLYRISWYAVDYLGNEEGIHDTVVGIDCTPPVTHLEILPPLCTMEYQGNEITAVTSGSNIELSATDDISGVSGIFWRIGGDSFYVNDTFAVFNITGDDGVYEIYYHSVDNAGNVEEEKDTCVYLDNTPPVSSISLGEPQFAGDRMYVRLYTPFSIKVTDAGCGVDSAWYSVDGGVEMFFVPPFSFDLSGYSEGEHTISYWSRDRLGNREAINRLDVAVDETPPVCELIVGKPSYVYGDTVLVSSHTPESLKAEDPVSSGVASGVGKIKWSINGQDYESGDSSVVFYLVGDDGIYKVDYLAVDHVSNSGVKQSMIFVLDNTPPSVEIICPPDSVMVNQDVRIKARIYDMHVAHWYLEYGRGADPGTWELISEGSSDTSGYIGEWIATSCEDGLYAVRLRAVDHAGNESEDRILVRVGVPEFKFEIKGLSKPEGVAVDMEHGEVRRIYVAERNGKRVSVFNRNGSFLWEIDSLHHPDDVWVGDRISITLWGAKENRCHHKVFLQYNLTGDSLLLGIDSLNHPDGVEVYNGYAYVAVTNQKEIVRIDTNGVVYHFADAGGRIEGIGVDDSGYVYTCLISHKKCHCDSVLKYNPEGEEIFSFGGHGNAPGRFNKPSDVEIDEGFGIWVVDRNNDRIQYFDRDGNPLLVFGDKGERCGLFNKPEGIAVAKEVDERWIYVADRNNDRVCAFRVFWTDVSPMVKGLTLNGNEKLMIEECVPYPNPFDPDEENSHIRVVVNKECDIEIRIFTLTGEPVFDRILHSSGGVNEVVWTGRDMGNQLMRNGIYNVLVRVSNGDEVDVARTKIMLMRR